MRHPHQEQPEEKAQPQALITGYYNASIGLIGDHDHGVEAQLAASPFTPRYIAKWARIDLVMRLGGLHAEQRFEEMGLGILRGRSRCLAPTRVIPDAGNLQPVTGFEP